MKAVINNFTLRVATVNGSGSQSANNILLRSIFEMGVPVAGKNIFPSNIAGLPTWYNIRVSEEGYIAHRPEIEILVLMNQDTFAQDLAEAKAGTAVIYHDKLTAPKLPEGLIYYPVPFQKLVNDVCDVASLRKLVINMVYVGAVAELLGIDYDKIRLSLEKQFKNKAKAIDLNWKAVCAGRDFVKANLPKKDPFKIGPSNKTKGKIIISGNEAAAVGCLFGGCTVFAWYPITPASSLGESVIDYFGRFRRNGGADGEASFAVVQAEDELAALGMVLGAGWAGCRAATSTSGPGLSLMAEFAGLSYFAEVPAVVFDVQRLGPSTGLPTRTSQGDILFTHFISHGDTQHLALIPATPKECYEFAMEAFNLAEEFQTLVFVMSDLDLGMNHWMSEPFPYPTEPFRRGKVLTKEQVENLGGFERYGDPDGDGIPYRTLPGTDSPKAAYFTRGSGHNAKAQYTEKSEEWKWILDRIARKMETAKKRIPQPVVEKGAGKIGLIAYGTSHAAVQEARDGLARQGVKTGYLRLRSLPLNGVVENFIKDYEKIYVVDQNQQGQMAGLIRMRCPAVAGKVHNILHYDGMPIDAGSIVKQINCELSS